MDGYRSRHNSYAHHGGLQSPQLPPPSQLHLSTDSSGFTRTNTLPPISNLQAPPSHHSSASNSNGLNGSSRSGYSYTNGNGVNGTNGNHHQQLPSLPASGAGSSWGHHRTSSSRDELHPSHYDHPPPPHRSDSSSSRSNGVKRESLQGPFDRNAPHHHSQQLVPETPISATGPSSKEQEDGMPATSDFVKKLFK